MKKYFGLCIVALSLGLTSCGDYLDKMPDNRATITTTSDIRLYSYICISYGTLCLYYRDVLRQYCKGSKPHLYNL